MSLTKEYMRYVPEGNCNLIGSAGCNSAFVVMHGRQGRYLAVGACEHVYVYDLRLGEKVAVLLGEKSPAVTVCASPNNRHLSVGYVDGNIQVFDLDTAEVICTFAGHTSAVTALAYDAAGLNLCSGSNDTDLVVWDVAAQCGQQRLLGHSAPITKVYFLDKKPILVSSSLDGFVKFWDVDMRHCFKTLVLEDKYVWSFSFVRNEKYLVTCCGTSEELKVWKLTEAENDNRPFELNDLMRFDLLNIEDTNDVSVRSLQCELFCSLVRKTTGKVTGMWSDPSGHILACQGKNNLIELFYFCSNEEMQVRRRKRLKKLRDNSQNQMEIDETTSQLHEASDKIKRLSSIELDAQPKAFDVTVGQSELRIAITTNQNSLLLYSLNYEEKHAKPQLLRSIVNAGHRNDMHLVAFSNDNLAIVSGSSEAIKLWNRRTMNCIRTVPVLKPTNVTFVPGDRHVLIGLQNGSILIVDISVGNIVETLPAHTGKLTSLALTPDFEGCVTGGEDCDIKFWKFELVTKEIAESKSKVLTLSVTRKFTLKHSIICVKLSPNNKLLAASLENSNVELYFVDTFQLFRSLYGHSLNVLCMDISADSSLIATGSADRTVKLWSMAHGNILTSLLAHNGAVTGVQFVGKSRYLFTCGQDGSVKQWDGGSFKKIITLHGHIGKAYGLAVSPSGEYVVSIGQDRVLRMYSKSDQLLVLQDEEEEERARQEAAELKDESTVIPGIPGLILPSRKTVGSERGTENILECLEICDEYKSQLESIEKSNNLSNLHPLMQAYNVTTAHDFFFETVLQIRACDLEQALVPLPFDSICEILHLIYKLLKTRNDNIQCLSKMTNFVVQIHHGAIVSNCVLKPLLKKIYKLLSVKLDELKGLTGYVLFGLRHLQEEIEKAEGVTLFRDAIVNAKKKKDHKKKRVSRKRALIQTLG